MLVATSVLATAAGCAPFVQPMAPENGAPPPRIGPTLVLDISNKSSADIAVGHEFDAGNAGGGSEGSVEACTRIRGQYGEVAEAYKVHVAGEAVYEGRVPAEAPRDAFIVVRIEVAADERPTVIGIPDWTRIGPPSINAPIEGCG